MAIDLLNSFLQRGQNVSSNQNSSKSQAQVQTQAAQNVPRNMQVMRAIKALQAGHTIQGEIVSVKGDEVQLAIMKDMIIDAKLAQSMNLTQGMFMAFQIKSNNSQGLSLMPLFTNTSVDPNAVKALDMAGISVNERSLEMVQTLMERGMPIDKQSIQDIYRDVVGYKDAAVKDIISLHQMELPVTRDNLTQASLYQNKQHYLTQSFSEIGEAIGKQLEILVSQGKTEEAAALLQKLQSFVSGMKEGAGNQGNMNSEANGQALPSGEAIQTENGKAGVFTGEMPVKDTLVDNKEISQDLKNGEITDKSVVLEKMGQNTEQDTNSENMQKLQKNSDPWRQLSDLIFSEKNVGKISKTFEKIWGKEIEKQWLLEPESVADKEKVVSHFEKLSRQVKQLESIFEQANLTKGDAAKALHNTSSNLDFLNQLNQLHAYIQLPLKMTNQDAHGELYVFTNKKAMNRKDGKVTALLHLDMENLGNMDIYVALEDKKVSTNFYLEKEEYLDFLESHMEMLTSRLNKRGYSCDIKTTLRASEDSEPIIKKIEKEQNQPIMLSMQAFDMRA